MLVSSKILENAVDSLNEALNHFNNAIDGKNRSYKYVIIHFSHFCELIFKYYLLKIHPLLIYKEIFSDPKSFNTKKAKTIGFFEAINFILNEEKLKISESDEITS